MISEEFVQLLQSKYGDFGVEEMLAFNQKIAILPTKEDNESGVYFFSQLAGIAKDIKKIKKKSFSWTEPLGRERQDFFKILVKMNGLYFTEFCNNDYLMQKLPIEVFKLYVSVNYGRVGGSTTYDSVIRALTLMLQFFNTSVFLKDCAFLPRISSKNCFLYDPIFRQKVRDHNRSNASIKAKYFNASFNLKEFVFMCINQFFPNVGWRWTGQDHLAYVETLKLVIHMFEYGLWDNNDINKLLTSLYSVSEIMFNLENFLKKDCGSLPQSYAEQQSQGCSTAREMTAASFLHMILMYLDEDVNDKMCSFNLNSLPGKTADSTACVYNEKKLETIFKYSTFNKNKLYTYFSYILVTYLGRHIVIKAGLPAIGSDDLSYYLSLLFNYISDINGDFYKISIKMMKPQYFPFYYLKQDNWYATVTVGFKNKLEDLINDVKLQMYGQLNLDYGAFLSKIQGVFNEIYAYLKQQENDAIESGGNGETCKLVLCLHNIPQYILALLQLIVEFDQEKELTTPLFLFSLNLIRKISQDNNVAFNQIFSGGNFSHMEKLCKLQTNMMNVILEKLVTRADTLPLVDYNPAILKLNMQMYEDQLKCFVDAVNACRQTNDINAFKSINVLTLHSYNEILNRLLETFVNKRSKYELYVANILITVIPLILTTFKEELDAGASPALHEYWRKMQLQKKNFLEEINSWNTRNNDQKRIIVLELMRCFLQIFNRATRRFYTHANLRTVAELLEGDFRLPVFYGFFDFEAGLPVATQLVRLYDNFMVFRQNHLINNRFDEFGNLETQTTEMTLSVYLMEQEMTDEILGLKSKVLEYIERFSMNQHANKFLFCCYFPMLFKYYTGILNTFVLPDYKSCTDEFTAVFAMVDELSDLLRYINGRLAQTEQDALTTDRMEFKYKKLDSASTYLHNFMQISKSSSAGYFYDEAPHNEIYKKRHKGFLFLEAMLETYGNNGRRKMHLEKYIRYDPYAAEAKVSEVMSKKLRFNYMFRKSQNMANDENTAIMKVLNSSDPKTIIKVIDNLYDVTKTNFFENPESNLCFKVLKTTDILKNNISSYISYFFNEILNMDVDFTDLSKNVFTNSHYTSLILMMDNLIKISDEYRETFYNFLTKHKADEMSADTKQLVMRKIWDLHKMLYYLTLYKTYFDKDWAEIYTLYYLVSNFIQNLCEDNYVNFKMWFHHNDMIKDDGKSLFLYYFGMLEAAFHNTRVHKNKSTSLMLSDRPELFNILIRLTVGMTEFINGGSVKTQFEIYKYKIDVWVGIILRVIDDVDSKFYELKENVITFILGLAEGFDEQVINFMATNFPITRLYDLIYKLGKKIYIKQLLFERNKHKQNKDAPSYVVHRVTEADEEQYQIGHTDDMLDFYKRYDSNFSDHVIMAIIIKTYTLMRDLSTKVVRYENFIIEKKEDIRTYIKNKKATTDDLQPLYVWHFLKRIIVDIEINYEDKNNVEAVVEGEEGKKTNYRIFYFKKLPQCFFLTDVAKSEFRANVNIRNIDEKHEQFFDKVNQYDIITNDARNLFVSSKTIYRLSTEEGFYYMMFLLYIISLALNVIMLVFYNVATDDFDGTRGNLSVVKLVLSIILAALSFIFALFWFAVKYRSLRKINWIQYNQAFPKDHKPSLFDRFRVDIYQSILIIGTIQTFILTFVFSLLGLLVNSFFFTILLLLVVHLSLIVYNVAMSFANNYDKLFFTLLIILVVINSFSYLSAQFYRADFSDDNIGTESEYTCTTYFSCLMNSVNVGLRAGGGISDSLNFQANGPAPRYIGRLVFDVFFFVIVNLILLGIFFGIIVDSFKELRDAMSKRNKDEKDVCFTCNQRRPDLERKGIDFDAHLKFHDIWNYFYYIQYLRWKPENDYDGIDIYVNNLVQDDYDTAWLPINRSAEDDEGEE